MNCLYISNLLHKVLTLILKNHGYVKAYDLLNDLKKNDASAKPPTVYRSLDFLMEHGFIHKIQSLNAFVGCSHPDEHEDCYFLICKECKNIEECCSNTVKKVLTSTSGKNNFSPNQVTLEISGICQDCS